VISEGILGDEELAALLIDCVSRHTGYPPEMITLDQSLESDLGLVSMTIVEIFADLKAKVDAFRNQSPELFFAELPNIRRLRDVMAWHERVRSQPATVADAPERRDAVRSRGEAFVPGRTPLERWIPTAAPLPARAEGPADTRIGTADRICLVGDDDALAAAFRAGLSRRGAAVVQLVPGTRNRALGPDLYEVAMESAADELHTPADGVDGGFTALINLLGATNAGDDDFYVAEKHFRMIKPLADDLLRTAREARVSVVNVSAMDGAFGLRGDRSYPVGQAGCCGLTKALHREWPWARVFCVDIDPQEEPAAAAEAVLREIESGDGELEIGLRGAERCRIEVTRSRDGEDGAGLELGENPVVLLTGGARGITAELAKALAAQYRPTMVIVGRTETEPEEPETAAIGDPGELRRYLIERTQPGSTPAAIEEELRTILRRREILANLQAMREVGARVDYRALDARDSSVFGKLIEDTYDKYGRIDVAIHGCGILEDKPLRFKDEESFRRVFSTKVSPALILAARLKPESLKLFVILSSIAGRFGNAGQVDYSAANELLNKLARRLDGQWPSRVISIGWGPWDAGMASELFKKTAAAQGIRMLSTDEGVAFFLQELRRNQSGDPEIVVAHTLARIMDSLAMKGETIALPDAVYRADSGV
jgi:NAD(P)-dependent dehydrogenase (short-subunit alcohol dehydrogenase family)